MSYRIDWLQGSSPLTRGKLFESTEHGVVVGLIPAHAGKTATLLPKGATRTAHPRSRGENLPVGLRAALHGGSSPLTRGKPASQSAFAAQSGLIPAHAGKTPRRTRCSSTSRAHPRSRGENALRCCQSTFTWGSSPLTRGKLDKQLNAARTPGLIPAHAGKTSTPTPPRISRRAHPRSRGENCQGPESPARCPGSSPLTRGKREGHADDVLRARLIPAHAGKTGRRRLW